MDVDRPIELHELHPLELAAPMMPVSEWLGEFDVTMVEPSRLRVSVLYQRPVTKNGEKLVWKIAADFSWAKFGVITVVRRRDGEDALYEVVDGQHRAVAAITRGVSLIPALVVSEQAASVFVGINTERLSVAPHLVFLAKVQAGDPAACSIACMLADLEIEIPRSMPAGGLGPNQTMAVGVIERLVAQHEATVVGLAMEALVDVFMPLKGSFIRSLTLVVSRMFDLVENEGGNLSEMLDALVVVISGRGLLLIEEEASDLKNRVGGQQWRHMARLIGSRLVEHGVPDLDLGVR